MGKWKYSRPIHGRAYAGVEEVVAASAGVQQALWQLSLALEWKARVHLFAIKSHERPNKRSKNQAIPQVHTSIVRERAGANKDWWIWLQDESLASAKSIEFGWTDAAGNKHAGHHILTDLRRTKFKFL